MEYLGEGLLAACASSTETADCWIRPANGFTNYAPRSGRGTPHPDGAGCAPEPRRPGTCHPRRFVTVGTALRRRFRVRREERQGFRVSSTITPTAARRCSSSRRRPSPWATTTGRRAAAREDSAAHSGGPERSGPLPPHGPGGEPAGADGTGCGAGRGHVGPRLPLHVAGLRDRVPG